MTETSPKEDQALAAFQEIRDQAFLPVIAWTSYFDTVQVSLRSRLPKGFRAQLLERGAGAVELYRSEKNWRRPFGVRIAQPLMGALQLLSQIAPDHVVNRVDLAFDFRVKDYIAALALCGFVHRQLTQPWHGKSQRCEIETTTYYRLANHGRNLTFYPEECSRHDQEPGFHLELRYHGAAACRRIGVETVPDLRAVTFEQIANRDCRLSFIDEQKVRKRILKMADRRARICRNNSKSTETRTSVADRMLCVLAHATRTENYVADELNQLPVQPLIDAFPKLAKNALFHVPLFP